MANEQVYLVERYNQAQRLTRDEVEERLARGELTFSDRLSLDNGGTWMRIGEHEHFKGHPARKNAADLPECPEDKVLPDGMKTQITRLDLEEQLPPEDSIFNHPDPTPQGLRPFAKQGGVLLAMLVGVFVGLRYWLNSPDAPIRGANREYRAPASKSAPNTKSNTRKKAPAPRVRNTNRNSTRRAAPAAPAPRRNVRKNANDLSQEEIKRIRKENARIRNEKLQRAKRKARDEEDMDIDGEEDFVEGRDGREERDDDLNDSERRRPAGEDFEIEDVEASEEDFDSPDSEFRDSEGEDTIY